MERASDLKSFLENKGEIKLENITNVIGFVCMTRADDVYFSTKEALVRQGIHDDHLIANVEGNRVRDWLINSPGYTCFPYDKDLQPTLSDAINKYLWPHKTSLWLRREPAGNHKELGMTWYEWSRFQKERFQREFTIAYGEVATHNHFVLSRKGMVFNRTAPIIQLRHEMTENDHYLVLGLLNSSTACFWMKQIFHNKGDSTDSCGARVTGDPAFDTYQFAGTGLKKLPLSTASSDETISIAKTIHELSLRLRANSTQQHIENAINRNEANISSSSSRDEILFQMIAAQEELDWHVYSVYGLIDKKLVYNGKLPPIKPGERAFEIALAVQVRDENIKSAWFERHNIKPIYSVPEHWPKQYQELINKRIAITYENRSLNLIEKPEFKRRWSTTSWDEELFKALKSWLLERIENHYLKHDSELTTCAGLSDRVRTDDDFNKVAAHYTGNDLFDIQKLVVDLVATESIPQMAPARYKPSGITKFRAWQETWDKQREEDAIDARTELPEDHGDYLSKDAAEEMKQQQIGNIPVPPRYANKDFTKAAYWPLRGKLDVPKERFFSLPACEKSGDSTPVIGWAGMNHLQRATAIVVWYQDRKEVDGFSKEQLMPMLVAIDELIPWLKQWHNELDPEYELKMGDYYESWLLEELKELDIARGELLSWVPPVVKKPRKPKKTTAA